MPWTKQRSKSGQDKKSFLSHVKNVRHPWFSSCKAQIKTIFFYLKIVLRTFRLL